MKATIWEHEWTCRVLVHDREGRVIDMTDEWSNRASAEAAIWRAYPEAEVVFIQSRERIRELNNEWNTCLG